MKNLTLYVKKDTPIHQANALVKITYALVACFIPVLIGGWQPFVITICLSLLLLVIGKVYKQAFMMLTVVAFIIVTVVIIQGLVNSNNVTPAFSIGKLVFYQEGLLFARGIVLNVVNILFAVALFILTTTPASMTDALIQLKFSPNVAYVFSSVFQIVPQMLGTVSTITDAQKSRGMETEGSIFKRMKAFIPLISPVIMNSLVITKERAIALEVRGFSGKRVKTSLTRVKNTQAETILIYCLVAGLIAAFVWRCYLWFQ